MKVILVDAVNTFFIKGEGVFKKMHELLEEYPNRKIIVSGANDEQVESLGLKNLPYEFFTLKHNPEKSDSEYFKILLKKFSLNPEDVVYFEHNKEATESAKSIGIRSYHYNKEEKDLAALKEFLSGALT